MKFHHICSPGKVFTATYRKHLLLAPAEINHSDAHGQDN